MRSVEGKWQRKWKEAGVFEPKVEEGRVKYFLTVPYPYTNGPLHIGHGRTYTIGDIIARFKRLTGHNVLFPMAFHITGTPIIAISERIAKKDAKTLDMYRSYISYYVEDREKIEEILESFKDPLRLATFFAEKVQADFEALGYSIDWRRKFHTGEPIYNAFVTWQYERLRQLDVVGKGEHIVTYCLLHKQPEGEDDIQDADVNPVEVLEYTAIKFKLEGSDISLLASTLRPETLLGATNMWVNPEADYAIVEFKGEKLLVSKKAWVKLTHQYVEPDMRVVGELKGAELVGKTVETPLGQKLLILPASFVDPDNATGIVYSEPSDAPYDYVALVELKANPRVLEPYGINPRVVETINPVKIIDVPGVSDHHAKVVVEKYGITSQLDEKLEEATREVYKQQFYSGKLIVDDPDFKGLSVPEAREKMKVKLISEGKALVFYELNRKAFCRGGGEIIVAKIKDQWFIDYGTPWWKDRTRKLINEKLEIIPSKYKKAFQDVLEWVEKRPCARKRGLGTKLPWEPEWIIESLSDSTIYMAFYTIVHKIREYNIPPEKLTPELFNYVFLGEGSAVEVSEKTGIPVKVVDEMRNEFNYWYPVDHRHTGIPHISNHLTFYLFHHTAIFPEDKWPRIISLNETVIREGAKMSKSKGNVIPLRDIAKIYSADLFRFYIASAASLESVLDWREKEIELVLDGLYRFTNIMMQSRNVNGELPSDYYGRWFASKFRRIISDAKKSMEALEIRDYVQTTFYQVMNLLEQYRDLVGEDYLKAVKYVSKDWLIMLNPVIPHLTEELNELLGGSEFLSTSEWPRSDKYPEDEESEILVDSLFSLVEDVRKILEVLKKPASRAVFIVAPEWKREALRLYREKKGIKTIIEELKSKYNLRGRELEIVEVVQMFNKNPSEEVFKTSSKKEYEVLEYSVKFLEKKTGLKIEILWEDEARARGIPRSEKAQPLKPAIYVD
ncbi:leucine--tRNA ligase [Thermosphaera chiliense]|uniref:Leucine--tRNA ligase n=2 Tax=Thermosphaera chiliense TaxID=3402707 RepID=A0A7M1UUJ4_9CREN|nr:leucine--tRNA ligase [Thermosphaera aggregans]